jgi:hypothetical protein
MFPVINEACRVVEEVRFVSSLSLQVYCAACSYVHLPHVLLQHSAVG